MAGWISPTGFNDSESQWANEANAYDDNLDTSASDWVTGANWSAPLELTLSSPIQCNAIRFYIKTAYSMTQVSIRVYDGASWTDVYVGAFIAAQWEEKSFAQQTVEKAEFKGLVSGSEYARLFEFDFYEVEAVGSGESRAGGGQSMRDTDSKPIWEEVEAKSWGQFPINYKDPSLVLYLPLWYPYSDMTGSTIYSHDRNRHVCTVTGATWGKQGRTLDGIDNYISVPNVTYFVLGTGDFTWMYWFRPDLIVGIERVIQCNNTVNDFQMYLLNLANPPIGINLGGVETKTGALTWTLGQFYFLWARRESGVAQIYRDLTQGVSGANVGNIVGTGSLNLGYDSYRINYPCNGIIGECWIYSRALTFPEAQRIYQSTKWRYKS